MTLFHGSNAEVPIPRLMPQTRALDFGRAFYLTSNIDQASKWAQTSVLRRGEGEEETLRRLLPQRLRDQYAFKTDRALSCLRYREVFKV